MIHHKNMVITNQYPCSELLLCCQLAYDDRIPVVRIPFTIVSKEHVMDSATQMQGKFWQQAMA
jgi:hypothetical protein